KPGTEFSIQVSGSFAISGDSERPYSYQRKWRRERDSTERSDERERSEGNPSQRIAAVRRKAESASARKAKSRELNFQFKFPALLR
ncbi:MAG: hypothetical protein MJ016_07900, partial [Victivallaceae bacterium]|nr:hypothetical protein [Victivallaceae bacterium]